MAMMSLCALVIACVYLRRQSAMDIWTVPMAPMKQIVVCRLELSSQPQCMMDWLCAAFFTVHRLPCTICDGVGFPHCACFRTNIK